MKKTMLTHQTLDRFEKEVNINIFTNEAIEDIEYCAYCANIGAKSKEDAWRWFRHLIADKYHILLPE